MAQRPRGYRPGIAEEWVMVMFGVWCLVFGVIAVYFSLLLQYSLQPGQVEKNLLNTENETPNTRFDYFSSTNRLPFILNKCSFFWASPFLSKRVTPVTPGKLSRPNNSSLISLRYRIWGPLTA
jgi:hypothetical protein